VRCAHSVKSNQIQNPPRTAAAKGKATAKQSFFLSRWLFVQSKLEVAKCDLKAAAPQKQIQIQTKNNRAAAPPCVQNKKTARRR
jgi:hypothetical protein